jgi:hypothetical protein
MSKIGLFCKKEGDTGNGEWIKLEKRERGVEWSMVMMMEGIVYY